MVEIIILLALAAFLFLRLRDVLGKKTGAENPSDWFSERRNPAQKPQGGEETVIRFPGAEGAPHKLTHDDIEATVGTDTENGRALIRAKDHEPEFDAKVFLDGARAAYEMIVMAFEAGDKSTLQPLLAAEVYESFAKAIDERKAEGLSVDARFVGFRDVSIVEARVDPAIKLFEVDVRFDAEMIVAVRNAEGEIVEGSPEAVDRTKNVWTFKRTLGDEDPNWILAETGE